MLTKCTYQRTKTTHSKIPTVLYCSVSVLRSHKKHHRCAASGRHVYCSTTSLFDYPQQSNWPVEVASWSGQLKWPVKVASWSGQLKWPVEVATVRKTVSLTAGLMVRFRRSLGTETRHLNIDKSFERNDGARCARWCLWIVVLISDGFVPLIPLDTINKSSGSMKAV